MISNLTQLANQLPEIVRQSVEETKEAYLSLNAEQWGKGINKDGSFIALDGAPFYRPYTIEQKEKFGGSGLGRVTDRVTLFMTGATYKSADLKVTNSEINVTFGTPYAPDLVERTTDKIFGLTTDDMDTYRRVFKVPFQKKIESVTKLKFV